MKPNYILYLLFCITLPVLAISQTTKPTIIWQRTIGGNATDKLTRAITTADGGMVLCGYSNSPISGDKTQKALNDSYDFWVLKLSKTGATQWAKTYAGSDRDLQPTIIQTADSGYLLGGSSISPISGDKTEDAINQSFDYWVLKLDKAGKILWNNTIGGIQLEKVTSLLETKGGFYVCGSSYSILANDKTHDNIGSSLTSDYWVVKLNKSGNILWDSVYGGKNRDALASAILTTDGGILLGGTSYSQKAQGSYKSEDYVGNGDFWLVRIDTTGKFRWDRTIGGLLSDYLTAMDTVGTNGYILAGYSNSPVGGNKTDGFKGGMDYWIVRVDKNGAVQWDKTFGGTGLDYATSVKSFNSKIYVGGYSNSGISGNKITDTLGGMDFWTLVLDRFGNTQAQYNWGGKRDDYLVDFFPSSDTEVVYAGYSNSPISGDKKNATVGSTGMFDYWTFKTGNKKVKPVAESLPVASALSTAEDIKTQLSMEASPNPVINTLTITYNTGNGKTGSASISVYSNGGKLISQKVLAQPNGSFALDVSGQPSGVYYVVLQNGSNSLTKKIVKN